MRSRRALPPAWLTIILLIGTSACLQGEVRKKAAKKGNPAEAPKAPAPKPPKDAPPPPTAEDVARIKALDLRLKDWTKNVPRPRGGLEIEAMLIPDALHYKVVSRYLDLCARGVSHAEAIQRLATILPRLKRYESSSLLLVRLHNQKPNPTKTDQRVFTQENSLHRHAIRLTDVARKARVPLRLAGHPLNLRLAKLRVKKFWQTFDGVTRVARGRSSAYREPSSVGKSAKLSKPFSALVLEKKPGEIELLIPQRVVAKTGEAGYRLSLHDWKKYQGPFARDLLDLNDGRTWTPVENLELRVTLPPAGMKVSQEFQELMAEIRGRRRTGK